MKKIFFALLIITPLSFLVWKYQSYFSQEKDLVSVVEQYLPQKLNHDAPLNITHYVPADTAFYIGGRLNPALMTFMADSPVIGVSASDRASMNMTRQELRTQTSAEARFITYLWDDYTKNNDGSYQQLFDYLGLADDGEYAIYLHGLVPVVNLPLKNHDKVMSLLKTAAEASGLQYHNEKMGDADLFRWSLPNSQVALVIATTKNALIVTLMATGEAQDKIQERLAQKMVAVAFDEEEASIRQQYSYSVDAVSMLHVERLIKSLLQPDSALSNDFALFMPEPTVVKFQQAQQQMQTCQTDIESLVSNAPRIVSGYQKIAFDSDTLTATAHGIWEINNPQVIAALQQLQGYLPAHVLSSKDNVISTGLAFDVAQVAPAVTALWKTFTESQFTCQELIELQAKVKQTNPIMLGMVTGMAQGIKGVGFSVFDASIDSAPSNNSLDMLLSVETTNPAGAMSLMSMLPELADISIPLDGTAVPVNLNLPVDLKLQAAVKGNHIVVFSGATGTKTAMAMANESLSANALGLGAAVNYKKLASVISASGFHLLFQNDPDLCTESYAFVDQFRQMDMDLSYSNYVTDQGLAFKANLNMPKPHKQQLNTNIVGEWDAYYLDETCQWAKAGKEVIQSSNKGRYVETDDSGQCELFSSEYNWDKQGEQITMTDAAPAQYRDHCVDEWVQESNLATYYCELMNVSKDSFQCLYYGVDQEPYVYLYRRESKLN